MKYATTKIPGLTHCDLKPDNIYIGPDGSARISDFGLVTVPANILENLNCVVPPDYPTRLRPSGTPLYMSPEQWISRNVSISSDIYSLGCICLEMLTGGYAIRGRHMRNIAEAHIRGGALKRLEEAKLPEALKAFLSKCLQPNSVQRFQTWECVEHEIINLYDVLLHQKIEPENIFMDVSRKTQILKGETILSIGEAYLDIDEIYAAINCFKKSRSIAKLQNYQELAALAEANVGLAYFKQGQYERAIIHYQKAITHYTECGNREYAILNHGNVGNAYFQLGDFARAQDNITKVIQYTNQISQEKVKAFWKANLTNAISNAGSKKMALEYFLYTLEVEHRYGDNQRSVKFLDVMDMFMNGLGDSKKLTFVLNQHN
jgi:serine/threonine protein kinase